MSALPPEPQRDPVRREDLDVTLGVRQELGPEHDDAVIADFLGRVGPAIDERVDARLAAQRSASPGDQGRRPPITLAIVSIVGGFLMSSVVLGTTQGSGAGVFLLVVVWIAIAALNVLHVRGR